MNRIGGKIILWLLILALIVFTAIRTLHFLQLTFPPELAYVAYLGLAAFDIGILGWFYFATNSAEGEAQRTLAYGMVFVCMSGVVITTIADMIIVSSQNGLTKLPPQWGTIGLWGVIIVIVLNVVAGIVIHLVDPKHQRHLAQEKARDRIIKVTLAHIDRKADDIAPRIAEEYTEHWARQTIAEMTGMIPGGKDAPMLPPVKIVDADKVAPTSAASKGQVLDPYKVKSAVDSEKKPLARKSLAEKLRDMVDFSLPENEQDEKPILEEKAGQDPHTRRYGGDPDIEAQEDLEDAWKPGDPLPDNYLDWTESQWKQAKDQLDAFTYQQIFDETFPDETPAPVTTPAKKKAIGGKQSGKAKKPLQKTGKRGG